ncbi:hypothetical protein D3C84_992160 [compost metagenome]
MHRHVDHHARVGRPDDDTSEPVFQRRGFLLQVVDPGLDLGQLLGDVSIEVLVDLQDLQLCFVDLQTCPVNGGAVIGNL